MQSISLIPGIGSWMWSIFLSCLVLSALTICGHVFLTCCSRMRLAEISAGRRCEELLYGVLGYSVVAFAGALAGVRLVLTFALLCMLAAILRQVFRKRFEKTPGAAPVQPVGSGPNLSAWWSPALVVFGSVLWSIENLRGLAQVANGVTLIPWADFFFHARQIASFAEFRGDPGSLHWTMYGQPIAAYHYGSYMVPALVADLGAIPPIQLATQLYPVLGMLLTGAAVIVFAQFCAGNLAALVAVVLLFFVPDPSAFVPSLTRIDSYFFFQQVGVGGAYAVAAMGLALTCGLQAERRQSLWFTLLAGCIFLLAAAFKIQIVLAYGVFFFALLALTAPGVDRRWRLAGAIGVVVVFALAVATLDRIPNAPTLSWSLDPARQMVEPLLQKLHLQEGSVGRAFATLVLVPIGILRILGTTYGLLLPLALVVAWRRRQDRSVRGALALLLYFLAAHTCVRLLMADNRGFGDSYEINRKTLVLPYFVLVSCTAVLVARSIGDWGVFSSRHRHTLRALCALCLCATAIAAHRLQVWGSPDLKLTGMVVPAGLFSSADWLRNSSAHAEVVQLCENDKYNQLASLSGHPVYVAKVMINAAPMSAVEATRFATLESVLQQNNPADPFEMAGKMPVRWLLMSPSCQAPWERGLAPVHTSGGYRLYRMFP